MKKDISIIYHPEVLDQVRDYQKGVQSGKKVIGRYLSELVSGTRIDSYAPEELLHILLNTKKPQIYAESEVIGDGSDWTQQELSILGNINAAVQVKAFDDGRHRSPRVHAEPIDVTLVFTPGALLRGQASCDLPAVTRDGEFDYENYYALYERRILPLFEYIQERTVATGKKAVVTVPGIGCGQFAGRFQGMLGEQFQRVLIDLLRRHADSLNNLALVYYDPFNECQDYEEQIGDTAFRVRPLCKTVNPHSRLAEITDFEENEDEFSEHELYSLVAWDHVSWPGNDFYIGSRATDDGVKAAATDLMRHMTGTEGSYDTDANEYLPPGAYTTWVQVIEDLNQLLYTV